MGGLILLLLMSNVCYLAVILIILVVTAHYLVVTACYKVVTGSYCSLPLVTARSQFYYKQPPWCFVQLLDVAVNLENPKTLVSTVYLMIKHSAKWLQKLKGDNLPSEKISESVTFILKMNVSDETWRHLIIYCEDF